MAVFIGTNSNDNAIYVNGAIDQMYGLDGDDVLASNFAGVAVIDGGRGNDKVYFLENISGYIFGGEGSDWVSGGYLSDYLFGGEGTDIIGGGSSQLFLNARGAYELRPTLFIIPRPPTSFEAVSGNDYLSGDAGTDGLYGFEGNDTLLGGDGDDTGTVMGHGNPEIGNVPFQAGLYGGAGNDYMDGGAGIDYLEGGTGNDYLDGGTGNDILDGGADNDFMVGWSGTDFLGGGAGNDTIFGSSGNDTYVGGQGADVFFDFSGAEGGLLDASGNDYMDGGDGNDFLWSRDGVDTLVGGNGSDSFYGGYGSDVMVNESRTSGDSDLYILYSDVRGGDLDMIYGIVPGQDYIILARGYEGAVSYFTSGDTSYGVIAADGGYYAFGASGLTAAQLQGSVFYY